MTRAQRQQLHERVEPERIAARRLRELGLATALFFIIVAPPGAQTPAVKRASAGVMASVHQQIDLLAGRSTVLTTDRPIRRISLSTPDIADALVTSPREVLIHGKTAGTISLLVWSDTGRISSYDVVVRQDLGALAGHLSELFPGEAISVTANGSDVVIAGTVSSKYVVEQAAAVAVGYVESAENVVNLLRQQEGVASQQVMLRVRFAEVSRTALQELGASFFTDIFGNNDYVGRITTQQFGAPNFNLPNGQQFADDGLVFSDFLNVLAFNTQENIGVVIKALQTRGLFQSLAEPNLITQNATEAMFLAGGEYPYPVLQGVSGAVTVMFKEFGVRLRFTPTIVGPGLVHLKVAPEVSALDFSNAISISGFRVPSLSTRRTETEVELRDGQTFAVAGLLDNTVTETMSKIPGLGDIPILGLLFRSQAYQKNQTELVVMITPHIVRSDSAGVSPRLPDLVTPFLAPSEETLPPPPASQNGAARTGGTQAGTATVPSNDVQPPSSEPVLAVASAPAPAASGPATAIETTLDPRAEQTPLEGQRRDAATVGKAEAKRAVEEAKRAAKAAQKRLEADRKQAERTRKAEERVAREEAKRAAEEAKRAAKAAQKRLEAERKQAERTRKAEEQVAREEAKRAAEEAKRAAKAAQKRLEAERKQAERTRKAEEQVAREEAKRAAEEAKRAAKAEQKRLEVERKQAEETRRAEEQVAREEAKRAAEESKRVAKAEQKRLEVERKQAEKTRRAEEQVAREEAKRAAREAKRAAEEAKRVAKAEQKRLEVERKQAEKTRKEEEKRALAQAMADAKRYEREWKQAEQEGKKLVKERAKREAELERITAEFQQRLSRAQRAVDEIDSAQQRLSTDGWSEPESGRR